MQGNTPRRGMIADDLTGACDTGAQFAVRGVQTQVQLRWDVPLLAEVAELVVLTTHSRALLPQEAQERTLSALQTLEESGRSLFYKKIDSTLKGNIGAELATLLEARTELIALVAPAFPAMGRTFQEGFLHIHGTPTEPRLSLPALLHEAGLDALAIPLETVRRGDDALRDAISEAKARNVRCIALDATTEADLDAIANAGSHLQEALFVGSGGLAQRLAAMLPQRRTAFTLPCPQTQGIPLFLGSKNPITMAQANCLVAEGLGQWGETPEAACALAQAGKHPLVPVLWRGEAEKDAIRALLAVLLGQGMGGLLCSGGDTAAYLCELLGAHAIGLQGEVQTGVPWGVLQGGEGDGMTICTKAGGFGDQETLLTAVRFLMQQGGSL